MKFRGPTTMTASQKGMKCRGKVCYHTKAEARAGRDEVQAKQHKAYRIYRCGVCHGYHLTTNHTGTVFMLFDVIKQERERRKAA